MWEETPTLCGLIPSYPASISHRKLTKREKESPHILLSFTVSWQELTSWSSWLLGLFCCTITLLKVLHHHYQGMLRQSQLLQLFSKNAPWPISIHSAVSPLMMGKCLLHISIYSETQNHWKSHSLPSRVWIMHEYPSDCGFFCLCWCIFCSRCLDSRIRSSLSF